MNYCNGHKKNKGICKLAPFCNICAPAVAKECEENGDWYLYDIEPNDEEPSAAAADQYKPNEEPSAVVLWDQHKPNEEPSAVALYLTDFINKQIPTYNADTIPFFPLEDEPKPVKKNRYISPLVLGHIAEKQLYNRYL